MKRRQYGRSAWWGVAGALVAALAAWIVVDERQAASAAAAASAQPSRVAAVTAAKPASMAGATPFSAAGMRARQDQRDLWQQRLERAQGTLDAYRQSTRYPFDSQPMDQHPDQVHPNRPVDEEHALRMPGGRASEGVRLRTSQERVYVQGQEGVRFTVSLHDAEGRTLPLRVLRAYAREVPAAGIGPTYTDVPMNFNDEGVAGDTLAGDGVHGVSLQPATQGFAGLFGQIRVEVALQYRDQQGFTYFDILYTPDAPAVWQRGVREALEDGSLSFYLKADVRQAGRYVVTGRVDDATGKPFALLSFNDEVESGSQEIRLRVFGKLVRDAKPAFPLTLRDIDGFLLRADAFPDRMLMPRLAGKVHTSQSHPLSSFADTEWSSEERERYLSELSKDVAEAQQKVDQLGRGP